MTSRKVSSTSSTRRPRAAVALAALSAALLSVAVLALTASTASAAFVHVFQGDIPTPGCTPEDLAVDAGGDIYARCTEGTIAKFNPAGNPVNFSGSASYITGDTLTGWPSGGFSFDNGGSAAGVAVDTDPSSPAFGYIYVAVISSGTVGVYDSTGSFVGQLPNTAGGELCGVATNKQGDIFTGHYFGSGVVEKFTPTDSNPADDTYGGAVGPGDGVCYVAGDSTGAGYASNWSSGPLKKYAASQFGNTNAVGTLVQGNSHAMDVDPANDDIYVSSGTDITQYSTLGAQVGATFGAGHLGDARGLAIDNANGEIYASSATDGGTIAKFSIAGAIIPDVTTNAAGVGDVGHTTAHLTGHVDPAGGPNVTSCQLQWGTDTSYSETPVDCDPATPYSAPQDVSADLSGLTSLTTYHYRFVASNSNGQNTGADQTFTTPAVLGVHTDPATNIGTDSATLHGGFTIDAPGGDTTYSFQYGVDTSYGTTTPVQDAGSTPGDVGESADVSGLQPGTTYHYRISATNSFGTTFGQDQAFTTSQPPSIVSVSSQNLAATSADLVARINPNGADTKYHFEYGLTPSYGSTAPVPDADAGAGNTPQTVTVHIDNLQARQTYHFRVVATSALGTVSSDDQTFNFFPPNCPNAHLRQEVGANNLPDCRSYEIASAAYAGGNVIFPSSAPNTGFATNPSRLFYTAAFGAIPGTDNPVNSIGDLYEASRTNDGWVTKYIGLPASQTYEMGPPPGAGQGGLLGQEPDKVQNRVLSNPTMDRIVNWDNGNPDFSLGGSNAPYIWNPDGVQVDRWPTNLSSVANGEKFVGDVTASSDLSHFVFSSDIPFVTGAPAGAIYDNDTVARTVKVASLDSSNAPITATPTKVSTNGSHILMTAAGQLYMRVGASVTYDIAPGKPVQFVGMTADGSKVYFISSDPLVGADTDTSADLYMWSESTNSLTLVSAGTGGTGNSDGCSASWTAQCGVVPISFNGYSQLQGGVGGNGLSDSFMASADGDIYFYSPEQLAGTDHGFPGQENLFDYRNGTLQYVTSFAPGSQVCTLNQGSPICSDGPIARMQVSPDDSHTAFIVTDQLTAYQNNGHAEMYSYDAPTGNLVCDSCIPNGDPPTGDVFASQDGFFMTTDGRTFFSTVDALVPQDTNEVSDIYEYTDGRPQLISPGTGFGNNSFGFIGIEAFPGLVGVSADGTDVFFATFDKLAGQDQNGGTLKIYDARSGGGFPFSPPPPGCAAADECHGAGSTPPPAVPQGSTGTLGKRGQVTKSHKKAPKKKKHNKKKHHKRHAKRAHRG